MMTTKKWLMVVSVAILAAASGAIEITPVGTDLRFAVASIVLIFSLLVIRSLPPIPTGLATAVAIFTLRVLLDYYVRAPEAGLATIAWFQFPGAFYYFLIGLFVQIFKIRQYSENLLITLVLVITADVSANLIELAIREGLLAIHLKAFGYLVLVSSIRSIWIVSIVALIWIRQIQARQQEELLHLDNTIMMLSGLHTEAFFLRKTFKELEEVMSNCYKIYTSLAGLSKDESNYNQPDSNADTVSTIKRERAIIENTAGLALELSRKAHEIKKDFQRTLVGLEKFVQSEHARNSMTIKELVRMIIRSHRKYAYTRGLEIEFRDNTDIYLLTGQVYTLTSIVSNLVANAVEAIPNKGTIEVRAFKEDDNLIIEVADDGVGIPEKKLENIFDVGYTTKFNADGRAHTGIGLNHVSELTKKLNGWIEVEPNYDLQRNNQGTTFRVRIPYKNIAVEGDRAYEPLHFLPG